MKQFNDTYERIAQWKNKLNNVATDRTELKDELLGFLYDSDLYAFDQKRRQLVDYDHQQNWFWTPHFNWLYKILRVAFPGFTNKKSGSRLRNALKSEVPVNIREVTVAEFNADPIVYKENDEVADALNTLKANLRTNSSITGKDLTEQLYALKPRMDSQLYFHCLQQLYKRFPREATSIFYSDYSPNQIAQNPKEFVEVYMLAYALTEKFLLNVPQDLQMHNATSLILLLSVKDTKYLKKVLADWSDNSFASQANQIAESVFDKQNKKEMENKQRSYEVSSLHIDVCPSVGEDTSDTKHYCSPLDTLNKLSSNTPTMVHPLLSLFTRLAAEQLYIHHEPREHYASSAPTTYEEELMNFITKNIIPQPQITLSESGSSTSENTQSTSAPPKKLRPITSPKVAFWDKWKNLSEHRHIPEPLKLAEKCAIILISLRKMYDNDIPASELRDFLVNHAKASLTATDVESILFRLSSSNDMTLQDRVTYHLLSKKIYTIETYETDIDPIQNNDELSIDERLTSIEKLLIEAKENRLQENILIKQVLINLKHCLKETSCTIEQLSQMLIYVEELKHTYILQPLAEKLKKDIFILHAKTLELSPVELEKADLLLLTEYATRLKECDYIKFELQEEDAQNAINHFYYFVKNEESFQNAYYYLELLNPYLSRDSYQELSELCQPLASNVPQSMFYHKNTTNGGQNAAYAHQFESQI